MIVISLTVTPYLAVWVQHRYPSQEDAVLLPRDSLVHHALINRLKERPHHVIPSRGNLLIGVSERSSEKDMKRCNWLSPQAELHITRLLRLDFDSTLHYFLDQQYYRKGIDYKDAAVAFHEHYRLQDTITVDALLKKHIRWKHVRKTYQLAAQQTEFNFTE